MRAILTVISILVFAGFNNATDIQDFYAHTDTFLKKYVKNGSVAYAEIKKNKTEIASLYNEIGLMNANSLDDKNKKAFYLNAYNLIVIYSIVQHYPVKSPMDIAGFFDKTKHKVAGETLTLNELEKEKLLKKYQDARFHFALVCAAKSCPPLVNEAFLPEEVEEQLKLRTTQTINTNQWLKVSTPSKTIEISKIFEWYSSDFTNDGKSVIDYINIYRNSKVPKNYKVNYYEYDWSLNE